MNEEIRSEECRDCIWVARKNGEEKEWCPHYEECGNVRSYRLDLNERAEVYFEEVSDYDDGRIQLL